MKAIEKITMPKVTQIHSSDGDWEALYVDDKLFTQGHHVQLYEVFKCLGVEFTEVDVPTDYVYPDSLQEVMKWRTKSS
jgi:hypothetical protein